MATIEVDGKTLEVEDGKMLIEATDAAGIYIPRFCYHEKLSIAANCRMCLVEVEKAPKPLPACATPVMDGMKVQTRSKLAREAQQGTMEFLLINHPLDCPVCDQGGECPLQDQAMGYGNDDSRYHENKRVVPNPDIGPLVATEMTRCIHCTRCVRFGEEVAGVMEMGAPGRGEFTKIGTFLNRSIDSEVSGNIIDLCPVGALTSKPYRFSARSWELQSFNSISPHDCVGTNIKVQTLRDEVERVLPIENEAVNECWLADRDRYSYEAVNSSARLTKPMIKEGDGWKEVHWQVALKHAVAGLQTVISSGSANDLGALAAASSTLEEFYLLQKLMRGLGSNNIDHRLQQVDFSDDDIAPAFPALELAIGSLQTVRAALLIGANLRKEQPLLSVRLRHAVTKAGAKVGAINVMDYAQNHHLVDNQVVAPAQFMNTLAGTAKAIADKKGVALPDQISLLAGDESNGSLTAEALLEAGEDGVIVVGAIAQQHPDAAKLKAIAQWIAEQTGAKLGILPPANSAAGWIAGCLPHRSAAGSAVDAGMNTAQMISEGRRAFILLGTEPELDAIDGHAALRSMRNADFVIQISAFKSETAMEYADVLLPMTPFTESAGTYINCEGRTQKSAVAATPKEEARPAWKILRVLGNFLEVDGFNYVTADDVLAEITLPSLPPSARTSDWRLQDDAAKADSGLQRIMDMPMYRGEAILRHANALQLTADNPNPAARVHPDTIAELNLSDGQSVSVTNGAGNVNLVLQSDLAVPIGCVYIAAGFSVSNRIGAHGTVTLSAEGNA
jgi:NADH-quinone oxidoreductase subunit G